MSFNEVLSRLTARCSTTELCLSDIRKKLDATDLTDEEKEGILHRLLDEGYVDEARYARAFVRDKFRFSGWGRIKIAQGLRAKQIATTDIAEALEEIDEDDYRHALREALKHLSEREKKILGMRFYRGKTQMEVASEIGISQAQVSRLEKSALERIRKQL